QILFVPQGIVMCFYGIAGLFISSYLWCTILCNVGSGYNKFDEKEGVVCLFRWGFPGRNRRIFLRFLMEDIQAIDLSKTTISYGMVISIYSLNNDTRHI
ncbi:photosystem I assembly protein Ycf4, partial [Enterobacter hormaechei]|uniref:photosystem I assembly protein Ycf4 n=1 Tax=Enterobacter hormaechei TaxID=158836 RepID=UPI0023E41B7D